jgi:hypothetical protein
MSNKSWRHHYLPQFYLNGFTNESGSFKIYDVENKRFIKKGKDFHPIQYFFEKNANTITINKTQESNDKLEDWYSKNDNSIAETFAKVNAFGAKNLIDKDIAKLEYFIGSLYWRIPTNFNNLRKLVATKKLRELGIVIRDDLGNIRDDSYLENEFKSNEIEAFTKFIKIYYPAIGYYENTMNNVEANVITFIGELPSICSDNPILIQNPTSFRVYRDEYIFPLDNKHIFFRGCIKPILNTIKIDIDILTMKQAKKYISCTNVQYLELLESAFQQEYKTIENLREHIFSEIFPRPCGYVI